MYFSFSARKIAIIGLVALTLFAGVALTFMYKSAKFGDVHLATAMGRSLQKHATYVRYAIKFSGSALAASPLALFSKSEYQADSHARAIPVLLYHGLSSESTGEITPEIFAEHMAALHEAGWRTITLDELHAFLHNGGSVPERSFVLTFDDGARDSYYPVDPILRIFNFNAVTFLLPKYTIGGGTHYYLSSGEIRTMLESGRWEIGSHGQDSHDFLPVNEAGEEGAALANLLWIREAGRTETEAEFNYRVSEDLRSARNDLETEFSKTVDAFAFPFGEFGHLTKNYPEVTGALQRIADEVYGLGFYQTWKGEGFSYNYPRSSGDDIIMVKRIEPTADLTGTRLVEMLEHGKPKDLPFRDEFLSDVGWFSTWGTYEIDGATLKLSAKDDETGAAVVLDGSQDWKNYKAVVTLSSPSQTGFVIWARFKDNTNNAACNFGNGFMHAEDTVAGNHRVINGVRDDSIAVPGGTFTVEVEVIDRTLTCTLNGETSVTTEFLDESLAAGGVGIKIWDPELGLSDLVVHDIAVEPL